jgi:hypothetical protein
VRILLNAVLILIPFIFIFIFATNQKTSFVHKKRIILLELLLCFLIPIITCTIFLNFFELGPSFIPGLGAVFVAYFAIIANIVLATIINLIINKVRAPLHRGTLIIVLILISVSLQLYFSKVVES